MTSTQTFDPGCGGERRVVSAGAECSAPRGAGGAAAAPARAGAAAPAAAAAAPKEDESFSFATDDGKTEHGNKEEPPFAEPEPEPESETLDLYNSVAALVAAHPGISAKEVASIYIGDFQHLPVFFAVLFILSGVLGIASGCSGDVYLVLVTLTFATISAMIAVLQLVLPLCEAPEHATEMLAMPLVMLLASLFSAALTCQPLFCSSSNLNTTDTSVVIPSPILQYFPLRPMAPCDLLRDAACYCTLH